MSNFDFMSIMQNVDITKLMEVFTKYNNIDTINSKVKVEKYDNAVIIKIISTSDQLGDMVSDLLPFVLSSIPKENIEVIDKRG